VSDLNPGSDSYTNCQLNQTEWNTNHKNTINASPFGYSKKTLRSKLETPMDFEEYMISYRYLIVLSGMFGTGRLNQFLAQSGAVIMLQESDFRYHYSSFLKPWVHYGKSK
jgi:Glycosyl transferase family 90